MTPPLKASDKPGLCAAFAEIVAGWTKVAIADDIHVWMKDGFMVHGSQLLPFTDSADAVLPWLEKAESTFDGGAEKSSCSFERLRWTVAVPALSWDDSPFFGTAATFAHAAVIALLRSKGVSVLGE